MFGLVPLVTPPVTTGSFDHHQPLVFISGPYEEWSVLLPPLPYLTICSDGGDKGEYIQPLVGVYKIESQRYPRCARFSFYSIFLVTICYRKWSFRILSV